MTKIYLFTLFNVGILCLMGLDLNMLGTADSLVASLGILLLISIPFLYVIGLKKFGYWQRIKKYLRHVKDVIDGDLH